MRPVLQDCDNEQRKRQLPTPTPWLANQPVEPLKPNGPDWPGGAGDGTRDEIERPTHPGSEQDPGGLKRIPVPFDPEHLSRRAIGDKKNACTSRRDALDGLLVMPWVWGTAVPGTGNPPTGRFVPEAFGSRFGHSPPRAKQEQGGVVLAGDRHQERGQLDTREPVKLHRRRGKTAGKHHPDSIGRHEVCPSKRGLEVVVPLRGHDVFGIQGDKMAQAGIPPVEVAPEPGLGLAAGDPVNWNPQHGQPLSRLSAN